MKIFLVDIQTVITLLIAGNLCLVAILAAYRSKFVLTRPYRQFISGKFIQAFAWTLLSLRGVIPDIISADIGNSFLIFGFTYEVIAFTTINKLSRMWEYIYFSIALLGIIIFWVFAASPSFRIIIASSVTIILFGTLSVTLILRQNSSRLNIVMGIFCSFFCLLHLYRVIFAFRFPEFSLMSQNIIQTAAFLPMFVLMLAGGIAFLLVLKEREDKMLSESEEKFFKVFLSAPNAILVTRLTDGLITELNSAFEEVTGYNAGEIVGKTVFEVGLWAEEKDRIAFINKVHKNETLKCSEVRFRKKSGEIVTCLLSAIPVIVNGEHLIISSATDVTQRKVVELQLQKYSEELKTANATKDKFFSIIAHDLRSPFHAFLNISGMLVSHINSLTKEEIIELSQSLNSSLTKQYELLTDLLDWSRMQTRDFVLNSKTVLLSEALDQVIAALAVSAAEKGIEIRNNIENGIAVNADIDMLKLVLRNLIANSIKFTNMQGLIEVYAQKLEDSIEITVSDNGIGINEENLEKLFKEECRFTTEGTAKERGTGLGLILCKEIIEKHGGKIIAKSEPGKGSKFIFSLPL